MPVKDTKLEEKKQVVIEGTIYADEFRDRRSGKKLGGGPHDDLVTEEELQEELANYTKKIDVLPCYSFSGSLYVIATVKAVGIDNKPAIFKIGDVFYIGIIRIVTEFPTKMISFELEKFDYNADGIDRYAATNLNLGSGDTTFNSLVSNSYLKRYELQSNKKTSLSSSSTNDEYPSAKCVYDELQTKSTIHKYDEGATLTEYVWSQMKTGDILKVGHMTFIIDVIETTGESAYKGVIGKMISSITETSISIITVDWRTTDVSGLTPVTTTLNVGS